MPVPPSLRRALVDVVGPDHVLSDPELTAGYEADWTGRFRGRAAAVVRPADTGEVAALVSELNAAGHPVVVQGGNTGLVGGGVPLHGEVVLSLRRLGTIGEVDRLASQVTAGAGATLGALDAEAAGAGLAFGVDLAARDSATLGGMVATNAGGLRMLRYGGMRNQVAGIEAVLGSGAVISHLRGLTKDNTGYDLAGLLAGSEGTLGVVTRIRLRLVPRLPARTVALLGFAGTEPALEVLAHLRWRLPGMLEAAELFFADGVDLVCGHLGIRPPFAAAWPAYLLVEVAAGSDPTDALATAVAECTAGAAADSAVESDSVGRARLWRYREAHTEAINAAGVPVKLDIALPSAELAGFVPRVRERLAAAVPGSRPVLFGHAGDGNLHVNVLDVATAERAAAAEDAVLCLVASLGGSISAEHGIGTAKRPWLHLNRTREEIAAFRALKAALDPAGILNPHVLLPEAAEG